MRKWIAGSDLSGRYYGIPVATKARLAVTGIKLWFTGLVKRLKNGEATT